MLAMLMPGVRHLRTPLAVGYIWLLTFWILARPWMSDPTPPPLADLVDDLGQLFADMGTPVAGAVLTFLAYLIGTLSTALTTAALRPASVSAKGSAELRNSAQRFVNSVPKEGIDEIIDRTDDEKLREEVAALRGRVNSHVRLAIIRELDDHIIYSLGRHVVTEIGFAFIPERHSLIKRVDYVPVEELRRSLESRAPIGAVLRATKEILPDVMQSLAVSFVDRELHRDLRYIPTRLVGTEVELHGEYDRVQSEAEFRAGIALPILALIGVATWATGHLPLIGATAVPILLSWEAWRRRRQANYILAEAIAAGRIQAPALTLAETPSPIHTRRTQPRRHLRAHTEHTRTAAQTRPQSGQELSNDAVTIPSER